MRSADNILDFWFSEPARKRWFKSTESFDATIRIEFEATAQALATADMPHAWEGQGPRAHLALILALDQFPRNMYRGKAAMFAWDAQALAAAKRLVASDGDLALDQDARPFAYMPLMHSENLDDQNACVELCQDRLDGEDTLKFAVLHRDIIAQFGRFPHRNPLLGRKMTADEQDYLDTGGFSG